MNFKKKAQLHEHYRKLQRIVADATIVSDATPADKKHATDLPGVVYLRTEGKTAQADAIENTSADVTEADDEGGVFGVLIDTAEDKATKLYPTISVVPSTGTIAITASGITPEGRIWLDLNSSVNLSSADLTITIAIDYTDEV